MRATPRITWLLLSLSFLFQSVCSNDDVQSVTQVSKDAVPVTAATTAATTVVSQAVSTGGSTSKAVPTTASSKPTTGASVAAVTDGDSKKQESTQAPTKPATAATTHAVAVTTAAKPTDAPVSTQSQAPKVTDNPSATSTMISGARPTATNPSLPKTVVPAATVHSSNTVVSSNAATVHMPEASVPSKTSGTAMPVRPPGHTAIVGTTKIPKVSTDALTTRQQSAARTTITSKVTQEDNKGATEKKTVTVRSHEQTASMTPGAAGNTGATSIPSTVTKAGLPAAETSGTKAGTTSPQTTSTTSSTAALPKMFLYSLNTGHEKEEEKDLVEVCRRLMVNLKDGNCTLIWWHHTGKIQFDDVKIIGEVKTSLASQYYEEITKKPSDNKTLIVILASSGALLIMIVIVTVGASHRHKPYNENQQHLTEELHTVENGYHDNPTLEVMEVQPEMQEKKVALNGEFNDSWIVPIDNLLKEDIPDEEDTHL